MRPEPEGARRKTHYLLFETNLSLFSRRKGGRLGEEGRGDEGSSLIISEASLPRFGTAGPWNAVRSVHVGSEGRRRVASLIAEKEVASGPDVRRAGVPALQRLDQV